MKIEYKITFELKDYDKFTKSYPNFKYNYNSFGEWTDSCINGMKGLISDIEGIRIITMKSSYKEK